MISANKVLMLVRREIWENRSLWIAPLAIAGIILVSAAFSATPFDGGEHRDWMVPGSGPDEIRHLPAADKGELIYAGILSMLTVVQLFALGIVVFFYLLDCLMTERKDRSILFWKSLPISDTEVVTSKALTSLVAAPLYVLAISAVTQILFGLIIWARFHDSVFGAMIVPWPVGTWAQVQVGFLALVPAAILWYLPLAGYLMLVSVWARKNAFLWAVLPPMAVLLVESLITHTHHFADFLGRRLVGLFMIMDFEDGAREPTLAAALEHVGRVFTHYETWLGVLVAAGFLVAVIRIRRYRDDS
jgi:ABC-2 type transport system permease protein